MDKNTGDSFYTSEEKDLLELTKKIRVDAINEMIKDGPSKDTRTNRMLNELATSLDATIQKSAENRLKLQDNNNKEDILNTVAEVIKTNRRNKGESIRVDEIPTLPDSYIPEDMVDGETEIQPDALDPADFI